MVDDSSKSIFAFSYIDANISSNGCSPKGTVAFVLSIICFGTDLFYRLLSSPCGV